MNLLTSLMPGVRQLRTPLAVGALWLVAGYLVLWQRWADVTATYPAVGSLAEEVRSVELVYLLGALAFVAYIVGAAAQGLSIWFARLIQVVTQRIEARISSSRGIFFLRARGYLFRRGNRYPVRRVLLDTVSARYAEADIPPAVHLTFPIDVLDEQLESISLQLWHKAADQYQESDRLQAEAAFRFGVALPIVVVGVQLGILSTWLFAVPFSVAAVVLILQGRLLRMERRALLANALYQGLASSSTLNEVVRIIKGLGFRRSMTTPEWYAATAVALSRAGSLEGRDMAVRQGASELSQELDFGSPGWKSDLDEHMDRIRAVLQKNGDEEGWGYFERQVADAQQRVEAALENFQPTEGDRADWAGRRAWNGGA